MGNPSETNGHLEVNDAGWLRIFDVAPGYASAVQWNYGPTQQTMYTKAITSISAASATRDVFLYYDGVGALRDVTLGSGHDWYIHGSRGAVTADVGDGDDTIKSLSLNGSYDLGAGRDWLVIGDDEFGQEAALGTHFVDGGEGFDRVVFRHVCPEDAHWQVLANGQVRVDWDDGFNRGTAILENVEELSFKGLTVIIDSPVAEDYVGMTGDFESAPFVDEFEFDPGEERSPLLPPEEMTTETGGGGVEQRAAGGSQGSKDLLLLDVGPLTGPDLWADDLIF